MCSTERMMDMDLTVRGKNIDVTPALRAYVDKHTDNVQRYFEKPLRMNVLLKVTKDTHTAEVTVHIDGVIIRAVEKTDDMYRSIDVVFDKIERQIHKYKTRLAKRFKGREVLNEKLVIDRAGAGAEESEFDIVRRKSFELKPMSPEEAVLQMNLLGHSFYVFRNAETELVAVIYRRDDGKYGIIEKTN